MCCFSQKNFEAAKEELERAQKYADLTMDFYFDYINFESQIYQDDKDKIHLYIALF